MKKYHYIYKITRFDGKYYIGMHSTDNLDDGYFGSGKYLINSINYHGIEKHTKEIVEFLPDRESLKNREKELVSENLIREDKNCMNLSIGGSGGWHLNNLRFDKEYLKSISPFCNPEKMTDEVAEKCKQGQKLGILNMRKKINKEIELGLRDKNWSGKHFKGKPKSDEQKKKIGEANKIQQLGEKNSQYGTCWITKDGLNKKIKKEDIQIWLDLGWVRGCIRK